MDGHDCHFRHREGSQENPRSGRKDRPKEGRSGGGGRPEGRQSEKEDDDSDNANSRPTNDVLAALFFRLRV